MHGWKASLICSLVVTGSALGVDESHYRQGRELAGKAIAWLRTQQDAKTGGWSVNPQKDAPQFPAVTGLVLNGILMEPGEGMSDPTVSKGAGYILSFKQSDGGLYDRVLPSYNTAICVSALARVHTAEAAKGVEDGIAFLKKLQWGEDSFGDLQKDTNKVSKDNAFYGGMGYGKTGRPDLSNLAMFMQAMHDAGVPCDDPAYQRAIVFLQRTQMDESVNDMEYAKGSHQGGFIYSTSPAKDKVGKGESKAGEIEELQPDGTKVSRLRAYGSMTYAGFKGYIYANLKRDDPRVKLAHDWITKNYTLSENPGLGKSGMYYYYLTFSRALNAWGPQTIDVAGEGTLKPVTRDWANDLIDQLATMQNADGSFKTIDGKWMEDNQVLVTAYGLLALQHAVN